MTLFREKVKILKIIIAVLLTFLFAAFFITAKGYGKVNVLPASANNTGCKVFLTVSESLINIDNSIRVKLAPASVPSDFMGRASSGNRSAPYYYDGIESFKIKVEDKNFYKKEINYRFLGKGKHRICGTVTFRWKTTGEKISAGFPKYFYKSVEVEKEVRVYDSEDNLEDIIRDKEKEDSEKKEHEEIVQIIKGCVNHSEKWNENISSFNEYCIAAGKSRWLREDDMFWPEEKFLLKAFLCGEKLPKEVKVSVEGYPYIAKLYPSGESYHGEFFDEKFSQELKKKKQCSIKFIFTAFVDGKEINDTVTVKICDVPQYSLMHRKG